MHACNDADALEVPVVTAEGVRFPAQSCMLHAAACSSIAAATQGCVLYVVCALLRSTACRSSRECSTTAHCSRGSAPVSKYRAPLQRPSVNHGARCLHTLGRFRYAVCGMPIAYLGVRPPRAPAASVVRGSRWLGAGTSGRARPLEGVRGVRCGSQLGDALASGMAG